MAVLNIPTPYGIFKVLTKNEKVTGITFPSKKPIRTKSISPFKTKDAFAKKIYTALNDYFKGKATLSDIPVSLDKNTTDFTKKTWKAIASVPYGKTISYSELSKLAGNKYAVRAASTACGKNNIPLLIPCHRIIHKNKSLGNYSAGNEWKPLLIELEKQNT